MNDNVSIKEFGVKLWYFLNLLDWGVDCLIGWLIVEVGYDVVVADVGVYVFLEVGVIERFGGSERGGVGLLITVWWVVGMIYMIR